MTILLSPFYSRGDNCPFLTLNSSHNAPAQNTVSANNGSVSIYPCRWTSFINCSLFLRAVVVIHWLGGLTPVLLGCWVDFLHSCWCWWDRHLPRVSLRPTDPNQLKEKKHKLNCSLGYSGKRKRIKHEFRAEFSLRDCKLMVSAGNDDWCIFNIRFQRPRISN